MTIGQIIGKNIIDYRTKLGYTQDHIANYLGADRTIISKYENDEREISIVNLNKLADLFGIELEDLIEENEANKTVNLAFAFRSEGILMEDMESIASFQKIVKKYLQMKGIQKSNE
jgi:transcriptional regulator with XRE-family HTH domain